MKTTTVNIGLKQILNSKTIENCNQSDELLIKKRMKSYRNNTNFKNGITIALKKIFFLFDRSPDKVHAQEYKSEDYLLSNISNIKEVGQLKTIALPERAIINTLINNFEDKYTTPFLLYSLGYKYEEIADVLQLPTGMVKSRVFYLQQTMQRLLIDIDNKNK